MVLTADEVCRIIEVCGESQVSELKFGDLHLVMGGPTLRPASTDAEVAPNHSPVAPAAIVAIQKQEAERSLVQAEADLKRDQLDQMIIEDPSQAERLLIQGELEDDGTNADEDA